MSNNLIGGTNNVGGTIETRVARGIALLDRRKPTWDDSLDLERLDLGSSERCILGQVYEKDANKDFYRYANGFDAGSERLFPFVKFEDSGITEDSFDKEMFSYSHGFDQPHSNFDKIEREWRKQINARRF